MASTGKRLRGGDDLDGNVVIEPLVEGSAKYAPAVADGTGLYPTRSDADLAAAVWAAYRTAKNTRLMTDLELGLPLCAEHVVSPLSLEEEIGRFIQAVLPSWRRDFSSSGRKLPAGAPVVLIVAPSAARCAALLKPLATFHARIFKCFAKHLSLDDQKAFLAGPPVHLAVGTPHRLCQLLDLGVLSLQRCRVVVLDLVPDLKRYTLLSNPSLMDDTALLLRGHVLPLVVAKDVTASASGVPPEGDTVCRIAAFPGIPLVLEQQLRRNQHKGPSPGHPVGGGSHGRKTG